MDPSLELQQHEQRLQHLEEISNHLTDRLAKIEGSLSTVETLVKWVILPLIIIVGGLVGIKIALP